MVCLKVLPLIAPKTDKKCLVQNFKPFVLNSKPWTANPKPTPNSLGRHRLASLASSAGRLLALLAGANRPATVAVGHAPHQASHPNGMDSESKEEGGVRVQGGGRRRCGTRSELGGSSGRREEPERLLQSTASVG